MTDRRNPYFILGLDHGADADQAAAAFARATRRVRSNPDAPYTVEDVTWALHQLEQTPDDGADSLNVFRIPADPSAYPGHGRAELIPAPTPLPRQTDEPGTGRQELQTHLTLAAASETLSATTRQALQQRTPTIAPPPDPTSREANGASGPSPDRTFPSAAGNTGSVETKRWNKAWPVLIVVAALVVLGLIADSVDREDSSGGAATPSSPQEGTGSASSETGSTGGSSPAPTTPQPYVSTGDCLEHVGGSTWEATTCGFHQAEIISTHRNTTTSGVCPQEYDVAVTDDWGLYCALIIRDDTPAGGHWGIGPVHTQTCLEFDRLGHLQGKGPCNSRTLPVLATANSADGCLSLAISDSVIYWDPIDGSGNVLCVDQFHWDAAGLPPPD